MKGTVVDQDNNTIPGVAIQIEGTLEGAVTDFDGKYELITNKKGKRVIKASFVGYKSESKELDLNGSTLTW
ncbi:MAG: carboxypeptidase-like regulatory domain-containing protein, partial [Bizionia paragorgiae]|uniref:carboxypeptidase-like regulatory domain-containing protein n=1 Tax=Bizionia paragorgiae TaxID=283786 RepID=UPI003C5B41A2